MRMLVLALIVLASATSSAPARPGRKRCSKRAWFTISAMCRVQPAAAPLCHHQHLRRENGDHQRQQRLRLRDGLGHPKCSRTTGRRPTSKASMDSKRFVGPKSVTVRVTVGPQFVSTAELRVTANCRADIVCNPARLISAPLSTAHRQPKHSPWNMPAT